LEPTEFCLILGSDLKKLTGQFPEIAVKILEDLSVRFEKAEKYVEQLNQRSVDQHLSVLLELSVNGEKKNTVIEITLPVSKGEIASMINTSQKTLSRKLYDFRENG